MGKLISDLVSVLVPTRNKKERHDFSSTAKNEAVLKQRGKCTICGRSINRWERDFHHKDGNKWNNKPSNCKVVHTRCHRKKHAEEGDNKRHDPLLNLIMGRRSL